MKILNGRLKAAGTLFPTSASRVGSDSAFALFFVFAASVLVVGLLLDLSSFTSAVENRLNIESCPLSLLAAYAAGGGLLLSFYRILIVKKLIASRARLLRLVCDFCVYVFLIALPFILSFYFYWQSHLTLPLLIPSLALLFGSLITTLWERENERTRLVKEQLYHAQDRLKLYQEEFKRLLAESQVQEVIRSEQRRREFVRSLNHDLKAPVTVMIWTLSRLLKGNLSPEAKEERIKKLADTANRLVDLLHEFASSYDIESDLQRSKEEKFCMLDRILMDSVAMARTHAEMKSQEIELLIHESDLEVEADELKLSRIFDNLIRNAIVHNPVSCRIHVETFQGERMHQVFISDNGIGLSPELLASFAQLPSSAELEGTSSDESGSEKNGMGLAIVRSFLESMGGRISVSSAAGEGTTFMLLLPARQKKALRDAGPQEDEERGLMQEAHV